MDDLDLFFDELFTVFLPLLVAVKKLWVVYERLRPSLENSNSRLRVVEPFYMLIDLTRDGDHSAHATQRFINYQSILLRLSNDRRYFPLFLLKVWCLV